MKKYLLALLLFPLCCVSQEKELNTYLTALKTVEFDESKAVIEKYSFSHKSDYILRDFLNTGSIIFNTDIDSLKGYKAIISASAQNGTGNYIDTRFIVVMYFDKVEKLWKVYNMRESVDPCKEAQTSQNHIDEGKFYTKKEFVYRNLCYWYMMCGKITKAKEAAKLSNDAAKDAGNNSFALEDDKTILRIL